MTEHAPVLRLADIDAGSAGALLAGYGLKLVPVAGGQDIPGSYWGEPEAGLIGSRVYARDDTPVHSLLHEACHLIVLEPARRAQVHTDATDSIEEEDAVCYLQILLADKLPGVGRARLMADMDAWGYSFRLGSARAWFEQDAENAREWLRQRALLPLDPDADADTGGAGAGAGAGASAGTDADPGGNMDIRTDVAAKA